MVVEHTNPAPAASHADAAARVIGLGIVVTTGPNGDTRVLISRRLSGPGAVLGGFWEFPGGKVEPGETVEQAIVRELQEEVGLTVEPGASLAAIEHAYPHGRVRLEARLCRAAAGRAQPIQVAECRWVTPAELDAYTFPPANAALLMELRTLLAAERSG